jgi:ATP-dependent Clp protease ATP-binding subunit ClpC
MLAGGAPRTSLPPLRRRAKPESPFQHFDPRAREVVVDAQEEAIDLGHEAVGTEHLLLALLRETKTAIALEPFGLGREGARDAVVDIVGEGKLMGATQLPFSAQTKKAFELALRESLRLGCEQLGPEHLLLGVLGVEKGVGARILLAHEPSPGRIRRNVLWVAASPSASMRYGVDEFRVAELEGDHDAWQSQLNEAAERGYQLVQIVDRRAIFKRPW